MSQVLDATRHFNPVHVELHNGSRCEEARSAPRKAA